MSDAMRAVLSDDELVAFIESLPETEELLAELRALSQLPGAEPERCCRACNSSLALHRKDAVWCSHACRQWGYEQRLKERRRPD
jgi:hypothetical protein